MAQKRGPEYVDSAASRTRGVDYKRAKLSLAAEQKSDSSTPSSCSISEDSALASTPPQSPQQHTRASSMSSLNLTLLEDSDSSVSSSGTNAENSEVDSQEEMVIIGAPKKPVMSILLVSEETRDFQSRLSAFLPQLAAANTELSRNLAGQSMEDVDIEKQHIEMDLGLGVLEEKRDGDSRSSEDSNDSEEETWTDDAPTSSGTAHREKESKEKDLMGKLLGRNSPKQKIDIQEV